MPDVKKILIVRFSSIGDIVLTSPIIRCLHLHYPKTELHFLTKKNYTPLIENHPAIQRVYAITHSIQEVWDDILHEEYDYIIDLHKNRHSRKLSAIRHAQYLSFHKRNIEKWLLVNTKINLLPNEHIVERYFHAVSSLGVTYDQCGLDFYFPRQTNFHIHNLPKVFQNGYGVIVLGAQHFTKQIPSSILSQVIRIVDFPVLLIGDENDREKGEEICQHLPSLHIYNAAGLFDLPSSADIIQQSQWVLTGDTGMMHIAAALKKKVISVWGSTVPQFGMKPIFPNNSANFSFIIENKDVHCRPCSKLGFPRCPNKHFYCMNTISPQQIADAICK